MKYAMLVYFDEAAFNARSAAEQDRLRDECSDWYNRLVKAGGAHDCARLRPTATATTLREQSGKLVLIDGPFAETKEILGGFAMLEARDLDAAIAMARAFPSLPAGFSVELRPVIPEGGSWSDTT